VSRTAEAHPLTGAEVRALGRSRPGTTAVSTGAVASGRPAGPGIGAHGSRRNRQGSAARGQGVGRCLRFAVRPAWARGGRGARNLSHLLPVGVGVVEASQEATIAFSPTGVAALASLFVVTSRWARTARRPAWPPAFAALLDRSRR